MGRSGGGRHLAGRSANRASDAPEPSQPDRKQRVLTGLRRQVPVIFALSGVAVAQPVLDLFGRNPEFFVAGRYSSTQVIVFALVITLVPAVLAAAVVLGAQVVHPTIGDVAHWLALGGFAVLFGALVLRTVGLDGFWLVAVGALLIAGLVVWLDRKSEPVHRLLSLVALGNVVFVGTFVFASPTTDVIFDRSTGVGASVDMPALEGPVIFLVLDEFPVTTILDPDGTINEERYPNFARLSEGSTWFRNASSRVAMTQYAVPSLLTGMLPEDGDLPTYGDHPQNLFSLFGERYPIHRFETVTDMCPPSACTPPPRQSLRTALDDALVVYGHKVLPTSLSSDLPEIGHSWGNFGAGPASPVEAADSVITEDDPYGAWRSMDPAVRAARGQVQVLQQMMGQVSAEPALHMAHVALPHYPWRLTPFGPSLTGEFRNDLESDHPAFDAMAHVGYQVHSLQVGAADVAIGAIIDHLQSIGAWDEALVVVTSDHGVSLTPPDLGRRLTDNNREELLRVPLFIKAPGQADGGVSDEVAQTIDVLPSVVDLLDAETGWEFDGHSLFDGSSAGVEPIVDSDVDPALDIAAEHAAAQAAGQGWDSLGAVGELGSLVGSSVADQLAGDPSELRWELDQRDVLSSLPTPGNEVPLLLTGAVVSGGDTPPELVVAINGRVSGVVGAYIEDGGSWRFSGVMSPFFRDGANEVTAYEVESASGGQFVLHPVGDL